MAAAPRPIISIIRDNQSTLTLDTEPGAKLPPIGIPATTYDERFNFNLSRGANISANVGNFQGIDRTQCQFGYWNNDEFSFPDESSMVYYTVFFIIGSGLGDEVYSINLCCKLPKYIYDIFNNTAINPALFNDSNDADAARASQASFAQLLCDIMNNYSVACAQANENFFNLFPGGFWSSAGYNTIGNTVLGSINPLTYFAAYGITPRFQPIIGPSFVGITFSNTTPLDFVANGGTGLTMEFFFQDGAFSIYNNSDGAFATGMGFYTNDNQHRYRINLNADTGIPSTNNDPGLIASGLDFEIRDNVFFGPFSTRERLFLDEYSGCSFRVEEAPGVICFYFAYTAPRSTSLLPSRYYCLSIPEIAAAQTLTDFSNGRGVTSYNSGVIAATVHDRNRWHEDPTELHQSIKSLDKFLSYQTLSFTMANDRGRFLTGTETTLPPFATPATSYLADYTAATGPLFSFARFDVPCCFLPPAPSPHVYPINPTFARVPPGSSMVYFSTARTTGN